MGLRLFIRKLLRGQDEGVAQGAFDTLNVVGTAASLAISGNVATLTVTGTGGAPTNADYLVGTANADLSAEIVVGTAPGGELGGTWASPTVDATHSGSAHHAQLHDTAHEFGGGDIVDVGMVQTVGTLPGTVTTARLVYLTTDNRLYIGVP